jgi:hypothetical protein
VPQVSNHPNRIDLDDFERVSSTIRGPSFTKEGRNNQKT